MKPFNLEEAKAGKPVCTRDGRNARIICFDAKFGRYSIVALVEQKNGSESIFSYCLDGRYKQEAGREDDSCLDLFMKTIKHKGFAWISPVQCIYGVEAEAMYYKRQTEDGYFLAKIEWEE